MQQKQRIDQSVAKIQSEKLRKELREKLEEEYQRLEQELNRRFEEALKIIRWVPYDQNSSAEFFDAEGMFGVRDGFDVVIGNPPYINVENLPFATKNYLFENYKTCTGRTDIYVAFIEKSLAILNTNGIQDFYSPFGFRDTTIRRKNASSSYKKSFHSGNR